MAALHLWGSRIVEWLLVDFYIDQEISMLVGQVSPSEFEEDQEMLPDCP